MPDYIDTNDVLGACNRGTPAESGLCTLCRADCQGRCETWLSSMLGSRMLYPRDFGDTTAGATRVNPVEVSYDSLRIQGRVYGAEGLPAGLANDETSCVFPNVSLNTRFGTTSETISRVPIMTGALGSTPIARRYWGSLAAGAALVGFPIAVGENVVGVDSEAEIQGDRIVRAPELDRRIESYLRYYDGYGAIIVQLNVEDSRNRVAEYLIDKYGDNIVIELKWGQGSKDIGGEIQVDRLDDALFLKRRGYVVDPDPSVQEVQDSFKHHGIKSFARHSRQAYTHLSSPDAVTQEFGASVERLRRLGHKRISLKTGAFGMEALALALKLGTDHRLDLVTIDGAGGGTGMSPWNMMQTWGVPSIYLHAKAREYAELLHASRGSVVDISFAGGIAREDQIFKALALGAPYVKNVCMGRALMIPAFLGENIEGVLRPHARASLITHWHELPASVTKIGRYPEEIFSCYNEVKNKVGAKEMEQLPLGAVAVWSLSEKLSTGLRQLMAGARKYSIDHISREDIFAVNRDTQRETGIEFVTEALDEGARDLLR